MSQQAIREQWYDALAQAQAIGNWVNCYLREFALPRGQVLLDYRGQDVPTSLLQTPGKLLRIHFGQAGYALCLRAGYISRLGRCDGLSAPYLKSPGEPWRCANARELVHFLLERLAPECGFNAQLLIQTENSVAITAGLLHVTADGADSGDTLIDAEQAMLWGHAMHPTPKSREGVPPAEVLAYSPERRGSFQLHWFRVEQHLRQQFGRDCQASLRQLAGAADRYPCHPWEVARILAHPLWREAQARGWIEYLGALGEPLWPTSSVRTMYQPQLDYFLKLSIHVRLTNCVRKNAWYELESAVALTELLAPVWRAVGAQVNGFDVLGEPAASSLDFSALGGDADAARDLGESFGMLYRETIPALQRKRYQPQVAGALFTSDRDGNSVIRRQLRLADGGSGRHPESLESWFEAYASLLLHGVWLAFFEHGVVLEPHLQNTVIGFERGLPTRLWLRDLEGTKLIDTRWSDERLRALSPRARGSVLYGQQLGWRRVAYCALVNNLAEAIFQLCSADHALEGRLWEIVARVTERYQRRFGAQPLLQGLLDGDAVPSKNNLRTRLFQRADRDADYTDIPNPIRPRHTATQAAA